MQKAIAAVIAIVLIPAVSAFAGQNRKGTLKGKIEDAKGKPVAGADVRVLRHRDRSTSETRTDGAGTYAFELDPDDYTVSFDAEGYKGGTLVQMQQVEESKETVVKTIRLEKAGRKTSLVRGTVFDSDGQVLPSTRVKLERVLTEGEAKDKKKPRSLSMSYTCNNRGEFAFRLPSERARYQVTATLDGYKSETKTIQVNEDESVPLAFSLEKIKK
jgi:protocatechuate 3,4-dioxygenase beta subunit